MSEKCDDCDSLTNMGKYLPNANVVQLVCLCRVIIQDGERQQHGICCRVVNLKMRQKSRTINELLFYHCRFYL